MTTAKVMVYVKGLGWITRFFSSNGMPDGAPAFLVGIRPKDIERAYAAVGIYNNDKEPTGNEADWVYKWDADRGFLVCVNTKRGLWAPMHDVLFAYDTPAEISWLTKARKEGTRLPLRAMMWRRGLITDDVTQEVSDHYRRNGDVNIFPDGPDGELLPDSIEEYAKVYMCSPAEAKARAKRLYGEYGWKWTPEWDEVAP